MQVQFTLGGAQGSRTTTCVVQLEFDGKEPPIEGVGEAIRQLADAPNSQAGWDIALGRALQHVGHKLEKRGHGYVKHRDDVKAMQAERKDADVEVPWYSFVTYHDVHDAEHLPSDYDALVDSPTYGDFDDDGNPYYAEDGEDAAPEEEFVRGRRYLVLVCAGPGVAHYEVAGTYNGFANGYHYFVSGVGQPQPVLPPDIVGVSELS